MDGLLSESSERSFTNARDDFDTKEDNDAKHKKKKGAVESIVIEGILLVLDGSTE